MGKYIYTVHTILRLSDVSVAISLPTANLACITLSPSECGVTKSLHIGLPNTNRLNFANEIKVHLSLRLIQSSRTFPSAMPFLITRLHKLVPLAFVSYFNKMFVHFSRKGQHITSTCLFLTVAMLLLLSP